LSAMSAAAAVATSTDAWLDALNQADVRRGGKRRSVSLDSQSG
jgi:hypothetical protein